MGVEKNLSNALGITHEVVKVEDCKQEIIEYDVPQELPDEDEDYRLVRHTLRNLITKGNDALDEIVTIAKQNESARGFEVVSTLIKTIGETSKDLYTLQKQKKDLKEPNPDSDPRKKNAESINVEQAVFVGSAAELLAAIKKKKEDENIIDG
jgi:predicted house-cleaning noncanonical NTP pyrophosphatase (MazG superfamily)